MRKITSTALLSLLLVAATLCLSSCALFKQNSRPRVKALLVTGNFFEPRLLCELAQYRSKQPLLLFHPTAPNSSEAPKLHYLNSTGKAEEIPVEQFAEFLDFLNPRQIIFVGDESCCPEKYVQQAAEKFSVVVLRSNDWERNAQSLNSILKLTRLPRQFKETRDRYVKTGTIPAGK